MDTHENIPGSTETSDLMKQSTEYPSSSGNQQRDKALPIRMLAWLYKWFQVNTFAPDFLSGIWSQPIFGYLVALVGQLVVVIGLLAFIRTYPSFRFPEGPLILIVLLVALGWGAGPSIVALLVGAVLLIFLVFPPFLSLNMSQPADVIELCVYLAVGLTISIIASNTERARRTSEQLRLRFDTIIEAIPDAIALYDQQGRCIQQNRVAREMNNAENPPLSLAEMPGQLAFRRPGGDPFPFEALPLVRALQGETIVGAELLYRVPITQQDRLVSISAAPLNAPSGKEIAGAVTITHDLSERKIADEARQKLAAIVVTSFDAVIGKTLDGIITSWNAAAERMYGYAPEEVVGKSITLLFPPDRQEEFVKIMEQIKKGKRLDPYETMRRRKDGTILNVSVTVSPIMDTAGNIVGASAIARDISEQKRLQAELWQSKQQLEVILENIADGISVQDVDGNIVYMNETGAKLCGYASSAELLQLPDSKMQSAFTLQRFDLLDERGNPFPLQELPGTRALHGEKTPHAIIQYADKVSQARRWSLVKSQPLIDENGKLQLAVTIFSDITESFEEQQRKDEFISMASHELKTPVTSLKGFTNVLQRRLTKLGDEQTLHYLARMDIQLNKLTKIISDLLDISKMQAGKLAFQKEPFELDTLIQETAYNVQSAITSHHFLIEGQTGARILGDKDRLEQVFINLFTNAAKYSPNANKVLVNLIQDQGQAIVSVHDFGIGIDEAHHRKIFDRFYQVTDPEEKTYPGLGMGLYISKEIVERHDGQMWVESKKGEGATFFVALPILSEG